MIDKTKYTLKNTIYAIVIASLSSVATFYLTRGIAYGNISTQIDTISESVKDHHSRDDARDGDAAKDIVVLKSKIETLEKMDGKIEDIRNYLMGSKKK